MLPVDSGIPRRYHRRQERRRPPSCRRSQDRRPCPRTRTPAIAQHRDEDAHHEGVLVGDRHLDDDQQRPSPRRTARSGSGARSSATWHGQQVGDAEGDEDRRSRSTSTAPVGVRADAVRGLDRGRSARSPGKSERSPAAGPRAGPASPPKQGGDARQVLVPNGRRSSLIAPGSDPSACRGGRPAPRATLMADRPHGDHDPRPQRLHASPPRPTCPACTSQYDGRHVRQAARSKPLPAIGPHAPPSKANSDVTPPSAGPIESTVSRWPSRMPSPANGISADQDQRRHLASTAPAESRTPSAAPAT